MFEGRDVISAKDFSKSELEKIFDVAMELEPLGAKGKRSDLLKGNLLASLFFEPSTRTRLSFEAAMRKLGGDVIGFAGAEASSVAKGEGLADTVKTVERYVDLIVLRHPQVNSAKSAAEHAEVPVINAGDGSNEHPTQAMLDLYTIKKEKGRINGLNIALVGDLKHGRTAHSLSYALAKYDVRTFFVSPPQLRLPEEVREYLDGLGTRYEEVGRLGDIISDVDVVYILRIQKERFKKLEEYEKVRGAYRFGVGDFEGAKEDMIILHPLPRVGELSSEVDRTRHAKYFDQVYNGMIVRMALLSLVLGKSP
jgi:aspartate carbamoyltransferase catalytic subunit